MMSAYSRYSTNPLATVQCESCWGDGGILTLNGDAFCRDCMKEAQEWWATHCYTCEQTTCECEDCDCSVCEQRILGTVAY